MKKEQICQSLQIGPSALSSDNALFVGQYEAGQQEGGCLEISGEGDCGGIGEKGWW